MKYDQIKELSEQQFRRLTDFLVSLSLRVSVFNLVEVSEEVFNPCVSLIFSHNVK